MNFYSKKCESGTIIPVENPKTVSKKEGKSLIYSTLNKKTTCWK